MGLLITVYGSGPIDSSGGAISTVYGTEISTEELAITGGGAVMENGVPDSARYVNLLPDADCHVAFGTAVVAGSARNATPLTRKLKANQDRMFGIRPGEKIAVISAL